MSECVVRMEMPKGNCQLAVEIPYVGDWCPILAKACDYSMTKRMPKDCPILCQLPEKHGRLVDVTKIDFVMFANEDSTFRCGWNNGVRSVMQHAETIVPAERSETKQV